MTEAKAVGQLDGTRKRDEIVMLPQPFAPIANFVSAVRVGDLMFVSGQGPIDSESGHKIVGKVGDTVSVEDARLAARLAGLNALAVLREELGSLDRVAQVTKLFAAVNAAEGFTRMPEVVDGCSDLLVEVFGDAGRHARTAIGASELPLDLCLELDLVVTVTPDPPAAAL
jgi:enamine deaminase RidA (YjgF/YER057c/UK114 family)